MRNQPLLPRAQQSTGISLSQQAQATHLRTSQSAWKTSTSIPRTSREVADDSTRLKRIALEEGQEAASPVRLERKTEAEKVSWTVSRWLTGR